MKKVIDLSQHNGTVNFEKVKQAGISDVILRIGWIGNKHNHTKDTRFNEYYRLAKANGFNVGVYVYSYCENLTAIESGIEWVYNNLENKILELPVFLDLEDNQISHLSESELTRQALEFCEFFKSKGYESGVYASKFWFMGKIDVNSLLNYKIWLAEWNGKENHTCNFKVDLWQYTSERRSKRN